MPHFMALAWMCKDDYVRGGFRMLSMLDASGRRTAAVALRHSAYLAPIGLAATALGITSGWFAGEQAGCAAGTAGGACRAQWPPQPAHAQPAAPATAPQPDNTAVASTRPRAD
jgi:protoheme IX farnesyltransferase